MKKSIVCVLLCVLLIVSNVAAMAVSAEGTYNDSWASLTVGTNEYEAYTEYPYTVYALSPSEVGKYTVTCEDYLIGLVSYTDMWVMMEPSADTVNSHSVTWECSGVGPSILIAVETSAATVTLTVTQEPLTPTETVEWTYYENQVTPEAFAFTGDKNALLAVNTGDAVADAAVLGADGYYHLNKANGPILYAKLKDSQMSLAAAMDVGQLREVVQDENNVILSKTDFNAAVGEYIACADGSTSLYPLTIDLIEVFQRVGKSKGWYGPSGFIGGDLEDAWMFACYYNELSEEDTLMGDLNGNGEIDLDDATRMFYSVNGLVELNDNELAVADCTGDGTIDLDDATRLFYIVNGLI